jgi:RHS repeat-associated protein
MGCCYVNTDSLDQVRSRRKYWPDQTPVAGQQFDYTFDTIGNRTSTKAGGDQNGANQRSASYGANSLNQYTSRTVPGYADILGVSFATNIVTVGGQTAYRKVEYFRHQLPVSNSSSAVWTNIVVAATGQTSITGSVFIVQSPEYFTNDVDGNLIQDGRWTYAWDAENRLINMTSLSTSPTGSKLKLDFLYESRGRRIQKIVSTNNGSAYYPQSTNRFVYDGWNLIAVLNPQPAVVRSSMWGLDLSGSVQGAGGVGGLLEVNDAASGVHFAAFDGNGNVAGLVKGADGTVSAQYEFGPFGEVIRATGPVAKANPFRFSTKYQDDETDLVCYLYRYYSPSTGRWLSRDPIGERGGRDLYAFVRNDPISFVDPFGKRGIQATSDMNLRTVVDDFLNGGPANTYYFWPPHPLAERIKHHPSMDFLWEWYNRGAKTLCISRPTAKMSQTVTFNYTAPGFEYINDYLDWWGQMGEGASYGDYGLNVLGSFRITARTEINCCKSWRSLWVQVYNRFSEASLFRKPWNREESFNLTFGLSPVDAYITFEELGWF